MVRFLDKEKEMYLLGELFDILYGNMEPAAPFDGSYQEEKAEWTACVGAALRKPPRQMLLLCAGEQLAGFCMYYINGDTMMVEEVQIRGEYQKQYCQQSCFGSSGNICYQRQATWKPMQTGAIPHPNF